MCTQGYCNKIGTWIVTKIDTTINKARAMFDNILIGVHDGDSCIDTDSIVLYHYVF